ncbi:hypothetical protein [Microcella sp.]|uniref:hypothetical protein n=1 Tax=Microcella sp. TaxID=1913979 RepID=UPI00391901F7
MLQELDPFLTFIGGAFGASLVGLGGAWLASRREHKRWIREQRLSAYLGLLSAVDKYTTAAMMDTASETQGRYFDHQAFAQELPSVAAVVTLLGPKQVKTASQQLREVMKRVLEDSQVSDEDKKDIEIARASFVQAAQKAVSLSE